MKLQSCPEVLIGFRLDNNIHLKVTARTFARDNSEAAPLCMQPPSIAKDGLLVD